jgi:hypothetical protein
MSATKVYTVTTTRWLDGLFVNKEEIHFKEESVARSYLEEIQDFHDDDVSRVLIDDLAYEFEVEPLNEDETWFIEVTIQPNIINIFDSHEGLTLCMTD